MLIRNRVRELRLVKAAELHPNPKNWRTHPKAQREALQGLLAEIGYADALLARETPQGLMLIDGHLRAETTPDTEVPVLVLDLDEKEADKLLATLDPLAAMAGADDERLSELLASIETESAAVRELLAHTADEAGVPFGEDEPAEDPGAQIDQAEVLQEKWGVERGQLWTIGGHRLLCGNSTNAEDVARLMAGERAVLMNTDPPYGVKYGALVESRAAAGGSDKRYSDIENDDLDAQALQAFLEAVIKTAVPHLSEAPAFYLWHPMLTQGTFFAAAAAAADILIHRQIVWVKPSLILGRGDYHWRHELCFYGWIRGRRCRWLRGRDQDTVWEVGRENDGLHPTQKPVELFRRPIENHTLPEEVIFEPFSGSGSQLVAAEQTGRRCYALEIEPKYVAVALQRLADMGLTPALSPA